MNATHKILKINRKNPEPEEKGLKKLLGFFRRQLVEDTPMLYDFLKINLNYYFQESNDIQRILSLVPNNPELLVADIINSSLRFSNIFSEGDRKMITAVAMFLYNTRERPGKMAHLFLATCMLNADKTISKIAGEIWLKAVSENKIDQQQIGKAIGLHESIEFAPLKRFTDLMSQTLFKISARHDMELLVLVQEIIPYLPDEPIKNLKKLLEMYVELRACNTANVIPDVILERLSIWESNAGLKKVVEKLLRRMVFLN